MENEIKEQKKVEVKEPKLIKDELGFICDKEGALNFDWDI